MDLGGTISTLISHLLPNHDGRWLSRRWVSDELSPLLQAMADRDDLTSGVVESNSRLGTVQMVLMAIVTAAEVVGGVVIYICHKQNGKMTRGMNDSIHFALGELGARAPNRLPSFRV